MAPPVDIFGGPTKLYCLQKNVATFLVPLIGEGGRVRKKYFELGVGGEGQDTSQHFEGSFGSIRAILPM